MFATILATLGKTCLPIALSITNGLIESNNKKKDPANKLRLLEIKTFEETKEATNVAEEIFLITNKLFTLREGESKRVVTIKKKVIKKYWKLIKLFNEKE